MVDEFSWYSWIALLHVFTSLTKTNFERVSYLIKTEKQKHPRNDIQTNTPKKTPKQSMQSGPININNSTVSSFHVFFFLVFFILLLVGYSFVSILKRKITGYLNKFWSALRLIHVYLTSGFMTLYFVRIK